jgi:hypothetical protein
MGWSINDTFSARSQYQAHPTAAAYHDGVDREARMDGLIGVTAALATTTLVLALCTNWHVGFTGR